MLLSYEPVIKGILKHFFNIYTNVIIYYDINTYIKIIDYVIIDIDKNSYHNFYL